MELTPEYQSFVKIATRASTPPERIQQTLPNDKLSLPKWIDMLQNIYDEEILCHKTAFSALDRCLHTDDPIPFEEFLLPFIRFARKKLQDKLSAKNIVVSDDVHAGLERHLMQNISHLAGKCLELEYSLFRLKHDPFQLFLHEKDSRVLYNKFIEHYTSDGFLQFFLEYSTLARLLVLHVQQWLGCSEDLFTHLQADLPAIEQALFLGEAVGVLTNIQPDNSDPHHGGRTVCILTFSSGQKLVYKPKNLDIDLAFFSLLRWLDAHGLSATFKIPSILSRATYGWMEFVEHLPCRTLQEVQEYYRRAGVLMYLVYALEGIDCHSENVLASGSYPVLIDLETLFHQHILSSEYRDTSRYSNPLHHNHWQPSLLDTGFLPLWVPEGQQVRNVGGLGGRVHELTGPTLLYKNINTDAMVLEPADTQFPLDANVVQLGTKIMEPSAYIEYILAGFKDMYTFLGEHKHALLCDTGPLTNFLGCPSRFVFRRTRFYAMLLSRLSHPDYLRDAVERWQELDVLKQQPALRSGDEVLQQKIAEAECYSSQHLDIPLFSVKVGGKDLESDDGILLRDFFPQSIYELVKERIKNLNDDDLQRQSSFLRSVLLTTASDEQPSDTCEPALADGSIEPKQIKPDYLVTLARHLAEQIKLHTVIGESGSPTWLALKNQDDYIEFTHVGGSLFDGTCGIALFFATLEHITQGASGYRDLIIDALHPFCVDLKRTESLWFESYWDKVGIGGALGLGSLAYALCSIGKVLDKTELLDCAHRAALLITERRIQADRTLDVIGGSAGAILGLLKLYEAIHDRDVLQRAVLCGTHLVKQQVETYPGGRSWQQPEGNALTGFSHGAAGIAYALLRLYAVTGQEEFYRAAEEGLGYEHYMFKPSVKNWPSSQTQEQSFGNSWCHGAPGIGLSRLGCLSILDTPRIRQEIDTALETTQAIGLQHSDNLCCGNFGRLELLLTASECLHRPELFDLAMQQTSILVQRAEQHGGMFHLCTNFPREVFSPELFQGAAGVGLQLLRMAYPKKVPSVLLWR